MQSLCKGLRKVQSRMYVVLDTDDIDYETEHDSRKRQIAMQVQLFHILGVI